MSETLSIISIVSFTVAAICLISTVIIFIYYDIPSVIDDISGKKVKKSIEQRRQANIKTGEKSYGPGKVNSNRVKLTAVQKQDNSNEDEQGSGSGKALITVGDGNEITNKDFTKTVKLKEERDGTGDLEDNDAPTGLIEKEKDGTGDLEDNDAPTGLLEKERDATGVLENDGAPVGLPEEERDAPGHMAKIRIRLLEEVVLIHTEEAI